MTYIFTDPAAPLESRSFLFHLPTHTLAEHYITPNGGHHLRIHQNLAAAEDALTSFHECIQRASDGPVSLSTMAGNVDYSALPESIILVSSEPPLSTIIHYPAIGFTAGIREDGSKIPPHWRDPAIFTPPQRSHFIAQAADSLMRAISRYK
jgi:hypothetical protein